VQFTYGAQLRGGDDPTGARARLKLSPCHNDVLGDGTVAPNGNRARANGGTRVTLSTARTPSRRASAQRPNDTLNTYSGKKLHSSVLCGAGAIIQRRGLCAIGIDFVIVVVGQLPISPAPDWNLILRRH